MPSSSKKQHNFMAAVAKSPGFAKKTGVSKSVGMDFMQADKGRKFGGGGAKANMKVNSPITKHGKSALFAKGGSVGYSKMEKEHVRQMKMHGVPEKYVKEEEKEAKGMNKGGMACGGKMKYAEGGAVNKPYKPSAGDLNEKAGGDQEMKMRADIAERNRNRGAGRGPLSRNAMKDKPFGYAKGGGIAIKGNNKCKMR